MPRKVEDNPHKPHRAVVTAPMGGFMPRIALPYPLWYEGVQKGLGGVV